jgi:hypothetical protein
VHLKTSERATGSTGEEIESLAEIFKSVDRNPSVSPMRGFYVMRMKKDQRTGHYVGVATWIPRDQPLPGNRIVPPAPEAPQKNNNPIEEHPVPPSTPFKEQQDSERQGQAQVEDSRSEFNQTVEKFAIQRKPARNSMYDPYDSYEL